MFSPFFNFAPIHIVRGILLYLNHTAFFLVCQGVSENFYLNFVIVGVSALIVGRGLTILQWCDII